MTILIYRYVIWQWGVNWMIMCDLDVIGYIQAGINDDPPINNYVCTIKWLQSGRDTCFMWSRCDYSSLVKPGQYNNIDWAYTGQCAKLWHTISSSALLEPCQFANMLTWSVWTGSPHRLNNSWCTWSHIHKIYVSGVVNLE